MMERFYEVLNNVGDPYEALKITANHIGSALVASGMTVIFGSAALMASPFNIISKLRTGDSAVGSLRPHHYLHSLCGPNDSHGRMRCQNRWSDLKQLKL